jgi:hypothetical protein
MLPHFGTRETLLIAPTHRDLTAAVGARCLRDLDYKIAQNTDERARTIDFAVGKSELITSKITDNVGGFATRVPKLFQEITPLLELGDAIAGHRGIESGLPTSRWSSIPVRRGLLGSQWNNGL